MTLQGSRTLMAAEIDEIPDRVERLLQDGEEAVAAAAAAVRAARPAWATIVGRGTSDHAGIHARYLLEGRCGLPTGMAAPSVGTVYRSSLAWTGGLVIAVSQSGQGPDVIDVVERARAGGALTIAVSNEPSSPLALAAEHVLACHAGPERSVAATKTYVTQLVALMDLVDRLDGDRDRPDLRRLPDLLRRVREVAGPWINGSGIVEEFAAADRALIVSRGYDLATALEISLKLKETTGIFADGYSVADLEHGPVALATAEVPLLAFRPDGRMGSRVDASLERARRTGSRPWIIGGSEATGSDAARTLALPFVVPEAFGPPLFAIPGLLLAEETARARGLDPDRPAGLTKVTRTY
jgi:glucosamine--fructose-6-phosphate aminotransferase (isomerizing)